MAFPRKTSPLFWRIYLIAVIFGVFLILMGGVVLTLYLSAFEKSQPIHVAQEVFDRCFATENFEKTLKEADFKVAAPETLSHAASALKKVTEGKTLSFYATSSQEGTASYNVVAIDPANLVSQKDTGSVKDASAEMAMQAIPSVKIATIYLKKDEEKGDFGLRSYQFDRMEIFLKGEVACQVNVPDSYRLLVNGVEMGKEDIAKQTPHEWNEHLPQGVDGIMLNQYVFTDLFCQPEISCLDENGNEVPLSHEEDATLWEAQLQMEQDQDVPEALKERMMNGMKEYAKWIQDDGSLAAVGNYFDRSSQFYKNTAANPAKFVWDHNGYEFRKESIGEFYFFDENTFCCHVDFYQALKKTGQADYVDHLDMIVFARKVNGVFRIYDCMTL